MSEGLFPSVNVSQTSNNVPFCVNGRIEDDYLIARPDYPGLKVEYSTDDGQNWLEVPESKELTSSNKILLRTK